MSVRLTETALAEIDEICKYIEKTSDGHPHLGIVLRATFSRILRWLANRPLSRDK